MPSEDFSQLVAAIRARPAMYTGGTTLRTFNRFLRSTIVFLLEATNAGFFSLDLTNCPGIKIKIGNLKNPIRPDLQDKFHIEGGRYLEVYSCNLLSLNVLSDNFDVTFLDSNGDSLLRRVYRKGINISGEHPTEEIGASSMELEFSLDPEIWEFDELLSCDLYLEMIREFAYLFKGRRFEFNYTIDDEEFRTGFHSPNGLFDRVSRDWTFGFSDPLLPLEFRGSMEDLEFEGVFCFRKPEYESAFFESYVNFARTSAHGTHVDAVISGIAAGISKYSADHHPLEKLDLGREKILSSLDSALHVKMLGPSYHGAVREKLTSKSVMEPIRDAVFTALTEALESSPDQANRLIWHYFLIRDDQHYSRMLESLE